MIFYNDVFFIFKNYNLDKSLLYMLPSFIEEELYS
ncbi:hypothetical protein F5523_01595 [Streptococcus agalactiae]|uniref:Uncharacterized protein n=1 Tax=Streptococcus agalactiae serotype V (strain ATCC BAA-611 / 2603 V/R) TaxID=208435 RepID=Q8DXE8_STRA5|nr:hypothetical protein SAG1903 [Streptococcus agalactiae 2603V/R]AXO11188.1 hypothetical protein DY328_02755 [Streptococcus agalactiae]AYY67918.1 hypothetical protein EGX72_02550 [Streptococcus sp. FDAARGOS_521]AYZ23649.1 hypothetical protein EGX82_07415 [Streptococcus agalactiae]KAA8957334.1 hypothetical protein F3140_01535 [Streptococcus agalactiae]